MVRTKQWWHRATIYHLYVRSFQDTNGDGLGDLPGVLARLDTLCELGVDALWLSPFYPSPQADFGYDVSDFCDVDPAYGTMADLERLRDALHQRDMYLVLDWVPNHTSSEHAWFREACQSRSSTKRDWYIWADAKPGGGPPNNWVSIFGGSAWQWHAATEQYYLHSFLTEQPDLNWRNPQTVAAMHDVLRFWLEWGADGFRVDAIPHVIKDEGLRDNPPNPNYDIPVDQPGHDPHAAQLHVMDWRRPEALDAVRGVRRVVDEYQNRVLIGETSVDWDDYISYLGPDGFDLAFSFAQLRARSLADLRIAIEELYARLPAGVQPTLALSNHDLDRHVTRFTSDGGADDAVAKAAAAMLLLTHGTAFVYNGEEIGMPNVAVPPDSLLDPVGVWERDRGHRLFFSGGYTSFGRDPERTPMHWSAQPGGGFSTAEPWLPLGDLKRNVTDQRSEASSVWNWYRRLLQLRSKETALTSAPLETLPAAPGVWRFRRADIEVAIGLEAAAGQAPAGRVLLGTHRAVDEIVTEGSAMQPHEVLVVAPS